MFFKKSERPILIKKLTKNVLIYQFGIARRHGNLAQALHLYTHKYLDEWI